MLHNMLFWMIWNIWYLRSHLFDMYEKVFILKLHKNDPYSQTNLVRITVAAAGKQVTRSTSLISNNNCHSTALIEWSHEWLRMWHMGVEIWKQRFWSRNWLWMLATFFNYVVCLLLTFSREHGGKMGRIQWKSLVLHIKELGKRLR